jgi:small subunit ribosomal protein S20
VWGNPHHTALMPSPSRGIVFAPLFKDSIHVANIKSQIKRIRTNNEATERNRAYKSELTTQIRKVRKAIDAGEKDQAQAALAVASRKLDKAVSKGVIHKNQAANRKSRLAQKVAAL